MLLMTMPIKTPVAARTLSISYHQLINLIRAGHIVPPAKDSSGDYQWLPEDLARARAALKKSAKAKK
jgi:hypothetical protein